MVFRRRMLPPISSMKHYVQATNALLASGAVSVTSLVDGVVRGFDRTATNQVDEGAVVKAIFIEWWLNGQGASDVTTQFNLIVIKTEGQGTNPTAAELLNMQSFDNKKNILFASQGVLAGIGSQSIPVLRQWFKIPKGKQRFGLNDRIQVAITTTGAGLQHCGFATYKEYV